MKVKLAYCLIVTGLLLLSQVSMAAPISQLDQIGVKTSCQHVQNNAHFSISIDVPEPPGVAEDEDADYSDEDDDYPAKVYSCHYHKGINWVPMRFGNPLPSYVVKGGSQPYPPARLYVCRGFYHGGLHPGKLFQGHCNIGWGGNEIVLSRYEVLTSRWLLRWVPGAHGSVPFSALQTGYQYDGPLYTCRAWYLGGLHPGKVVNGNCNIGWGGREISIPVYQVLAR